MLDFELGSADCQNKFEIVNNYLFQMISHFKGTPPRFSFVIKKKLVAIQSLKSGGSSCLADFRKKSDSRTRGTIWQSFGMKPRMTQKL